MADFQFDALPRDVGRLQDQLNEVRIPRTLAIGVAGGRQLFPVPDEDAGPARLLLLSSGTLRFAGDQDELDSTGETNEDLEVDEGFHRTVHLRLRVDQQLGTEPLAGSSALAGIASVFFPLENPSEAATDAAGVERRQTPEGTGFDVWLLADVVAFGEADDQGQPVLLKGQLYRVGYQASLLVRTPLSPSKRETEVRQRATQIS
jgi:hypothetical protein